MKEQKEQNDTQTLYEADDAHPLGSQFSFCKVIWQRQFGSYLFLLLNYAYFKFFNSKKYSLVLLFLLKRIVFLHKDLCATVQHADIRVGLGNGNIIHA